MKLAFSTLGCPEWSLKYSVTQAKKYGFQAVEIRGIKDCLRADSIKVLLLNLLGVKDIKEIEKIKVDTDYITSVEIRLNNLCDSKTEDNRGVTNDILNGISPKNQELFIGIMDLVKEYLEDNGKEGNNIVNYFYHYLQAMNNTKELKYILTLKDYPNDLKAIILELLADQGVMEEVKFVNEDQEIDVDLTTLTPLMEQVSLEEILKLIEEKVDEKDVSIFNACQDLTVAYHASVYPLPIEEDEYALIAASIYYAALTNYGIDKELEEVCKLFDVKSQFVEVYYEKMCKLSTF